MNRIKIDIKNDFHNHNSYLKFIFIEKAILSKYFDNDNKKTKNKKLN